MTLNQTFTLGFLHILLSLVIVSTVCCFRNDYVQEDVMRIIMLWLMGAHLFLFNVVMPVFLIVNLKMTMPEFFENDCDGNVVAPATPPKQFYVIRLELEMNLRRSFHNLLLLLRYCTNFAEGSFTALHQARREASPGGGAGLQLQAVPLS